MSEFEVFGFSEKKLEETLKNKKVCAALTEILAEAQKHGSVPKGEKQSKLLYNLCTKLPKTVKPGRMELGVQYIMESKINNDNQLTAACDYFKRETEDEIDIPKFEEACGVGIVVTLEEIQKVVRERFEQNKDEIIEKRYKFIFPKFSADICKELKWADRQVVMSEVDAAKLNLLGEKTEEDLKKPEKGKKAKAPTASSSAKQPKKVEEKKPAKKNFGSAMNALHKVGENYTSEDYVTTPNTMKLLEAHKKAVGGKIRTRFPPEPNGILHIGHAKAMLTNFSYASENGGTCILRYDDTNPEAEEDRFFKAIAEMCTWLGHKPFAITHSSDYFHELYAYAVDLIKRGLAYVDHQTAAEIFEERGGEAKGPRRESPYRNRPIEESLKVFSEMRSGLWDEGTACLRMKMDMTDGNPQMWDLIAYRIKFLPHPASGSEWCIYPTYDFTHCLVDSLENITHSLCTVEFKQSRVSYYWLCNALDIYCPVQWEYSRLQLTNTVLSKRKILKLIENGIVHDWDDPRLHTLPALRRRGFPPQAINEMVEKVGITLSHTVTDSALLDSCVRSYLNDHSPRIMCVLDPLKVTIESFTQPKVVEVPLNPAADDGKTRKVVFDSVIYIDQTDFKEEEEKGYRRLTPGQPVGLSHIGTVIFLKEIVKDEDGNIVELIATHQSRDESDVKPKATIHWVSNPVQAEVRLYEPLLNDEATGKDFLDQINYDSLTVKPHALIEPTVAGSEVGKAFQFERVGYFCVDPDTTKDQYVFNLTVSLREDKNKK